MADDAPGTLWVVATPIGNLDDITVRALRVLASADRVLCEDTRRTRALFEALELKPPPRGFFRCDAHAEREHLQDFLAPLAAGERVALVSDAGTPGLNDPGAALVRAARERGHPVVPIPGPSALTTALSISGLGGSGFSFWGFFPRGVEAARTAVANLAPGTHAYFIPARDLAETMALLAEIPTVGEVFIGRELTKRFEHLYCGRPSVLATQLRDDTDAALGEAVLVFEVVRAALDDAAITVLLREQLQRGTRPRDAAAAVAGALGLPRRRVYQLMLALEG